MNLIAYIRVSTEEQADSGLGMDAQRATISAGLAGRGASLFLEYADEAVSGSTPWSERPGLAAAIAALNRGDADGIVVAKLDRLSRSALDFAHLMKLATDQGWHLIALDLGVDTSTPSGRLIAQVMAAFAEFEVGMIRQRTKEALKARRGRGLKNGRPFDIPPKIRARILAERLDGRSYHSIAAGLNADGVPTSRGGVRWYGSVIRKVVKSDWISPRPLKPAFEKKKEQPA